ncbi:MAG TPA: sigma factor-like helix-turn-helix DNA-binding protein [Candidatus Dormibacteraeota bacterium]|nr:sigma factor-like helix-turn-helix DNA-binding protein [Candidatus Dormibacteraeota bacterium]
MQWKITFRNIPESQHQELEQELRNLAARHLDKHLVHSGPDSVRLRVVAEENKHHANLRTVLARLSVPGALLASEETADSILAAAKGAFADIERQLIEHLERMRGEDEWTRKKRREDLRRLRAAVADQSLEERESFSRAIRPFLAKLRRLARFERAHLRARGQLMSDYPSVDDLLDEILARSAADPNLRKPGARVLPELYRIAIDVAKDVAAHERSRRRKLSLEVSPPREPTDREIDETFYDWYQPDELTKVEDLAADPSTIPEELVSRKEMQQLLDSLIASMPAEWRRALILSRVEGISPSDVAHALNTTEDAVHDWLGRADNYLRARLRDEGISPSDLGQLSYIASAPSPKDSEEESGFDEALGERLT